MDSQPPAPAGLRIAGAPISWGVCEVPGWGHQLPADRVFAEMLAVGITATELGPEGFLPAGPGPIREVLTRHGLEPVGGFVPVLLHSPAADPVPAVAGVLDTYVAIGAGVLVLSAATGEDGYDTRPTLDEDGWKTLLSHLDRLDSYAADRGLRAVLHPHVGTMVEGTEEVRRVLDGSSIALCLDTGHLLIGGTDPAELAGEVPGRIAHTHLKDVDSGLAAEVRSGRLTYTQAVRRGMYRPLGTGDVDIAAVVDHLRAHGYDGWYTLEQDTVLACEPDGEGPVADVRASVAYLNGLPHASGRKGDPA